MSLSITETIDQLHASLSDYIEATYHISDPHLVSQRRKLLNRGYEGSLTAFLIPFAEPAMAVEIEDTKYPERSGKYFIEAV